jgi:tripeptide aminopeptidase
MDKKEFGDLNKVVGDDIIVTDGNTLLGADDKAGVSVIIELCDFLSKNPKTPHPDIYICFTPDEEIGMGTSHIDLKKFKPDFAYTIDGDDVSCIEYETFNAASASVEIYGKSVHPGSAKNKMVNSMLIGMEFHSLLPQKEQPQFTEKYEGFNHLTNFNGNVEKTKLSYIIRNHDKIKFNKQKETFKKVAEKLNKKYKYKIINLEIKDQYYNMGDIIKNKKEVVNIAEKAAKLIGIKPYSKPVRGGTDGSKLTYMGIACPNIGAGGFNFHGRYEFCSINQMQKSLELVKQIVSLLGKDEKKVK